MYGVEGYLMPIAASPIAGTPYSVNGNPIHDNAEWLYLELAVSPQLESQRTGTPASQSESRGSMVSLTNFATILTCLVYLLKGRCHPVFVCLPY